MQQNRMNKKILVLDVDETLLNMEPLSFLKIFKKNYTNYNGKLIFEDYYVSPRPNLDTFLEKAREKFELIAFSVVNRDVTIKKLKAINILDNFTKIYGREDLEDGKKSLKKIAEDFSIDIDDVIGIDDNPEFFLEKDNVFKINPWFIGDKMDDSSLLDIFKYLEPNPIKVSS